MLFRLGYVAMTLNLKDCSPSGTVTVAAFNKLPDDAARMYRLRKILANNLKNTYRILLYNVAYNIKVYRLTSKLVPLATHPLIEDWDYTGEFSEEFKKIGDYIKQHDLRISAHPDHFTLINSANQKVTEEAVKDLDYHVRLFEAMGLEDSRYKLVLHIGGLYKDKQSSKRRFIDNYQLLPERIRKHLILENDDKSFTAADVMQICREIGAPMVLDVHHHNCVNNGEMLGDLLPGISETWKDEYFRPKIHFSSPKGCKDFRSHSDLIDINEFKAFLATARNFGEDFDVMLEAKNKDLALLKLSEELAASEGIIRHNEGLFEIE